MQYTVKRAVLIIASIIDRDHRHTNSEQSNPQVLARQRYSEYSAHPLDQTKVAGSVRRRPVCQRIDADLSTGTQVEANASARGTQWSQHLCCACSVALRLHCGCICCTALHCTAVALHCPTLPGKRPCQLVLLRSAHVGFGCPRRPRRCRCPRRCIQPEHHWSEQQSLQHSHENPDDAQNNPGRCLRRQNPLNRPDPIRSVDCWAISYCRQPKRSHASAHKLRVLTAHPCLRRLAVADAPRN